MADLSVLCQAGVHRRSRKDTTSWKRLGACWGLARDKVRDANGRLRYFEHSCRCPCHAEATEGGE